MSGGRKTGLGRFLQTALIVLTSLLALSFMIDRTIFRGAGFPPPHLKERALFPSAQPRPGTWALLISGGVRPRKNYPRYWNNISLVFCTLKALGWQNVRVLYAGGPTGAPDRLERAYLGLFPLSGLTTSPADLDADGAPDIDGAATIAAIDRELAFIGGRMAPGDSLLVFITDHGTLARQGKIRRPVAELWGETIDGQALDGRLKARIPAPCWTAVLAAQCWGRAFLKDVTRPKTLLIAVGRPNWVWSDQDYSIFPLKFCEALLGKEIGSGRPVRADSNGDGTVTLREAFRSACGRDHTPEWPILWVNGDASALPATF